MVQRTILIKILLIEILLNLSSINLSLEKENARVFGNSLYSQLIVYTDRLNRKIAKIYQIKVIHFKFPDRMSNITI